MIYTPLDIKEINQKVLETQKAATANQIISEQTGDGIVLLKDISKGLTGTGKPKFSGTLSNIDEIRFNVWNNSCAFDFLESNIDQVSGRIIWVYYTISKYGLVISNMTFVDGYDPEEFISHKYDQKQLNEDFMDALRNSNCSVSAKALLASILHMNSQDHFCIRFGTEFAALSYHDNCRSGLLAHTTKCLRIYNGLKNNYSFLNDRTHNDLMVIGLTIHDMGKVFEMNNGVYQAHSYITHRGLGLEYLFEYKDMIINLFDEEFYYMLASIILQHHGDYGENPKTIYSLLIHKIDDIEATFTSIDDLLLTETWITDVTGTTVKNNETYLNVYGKRKQGA